ncbi:MAG: hypothetical protein H5T73_09745 [Actinobacteria bacterium]|nr:hypothetical protein [Actinomycetota bacterium]
MGAAGDPEVLKIGVTGHRILVEEERIIAGIERALDLLRDAYGERALVVLSSLAEGADRLVAEAVLRRPASRLVAVIPFPLEDYVRDFGEEGSTSRAEFTELLKKASEIIELPANPDRDEGYAQGGDYVVDRCDVLIAVWDGREAQGRGGTGEMVARARSQGKPVLIVRAGNRKPGTREPTTLGEEQGRLIVEGLREADA